MVTKQDTNELDEHVSIVEIVCPVRDVVMEFGDKWSMLVLIALKELDRSQFSDLCQHIDDISQRMLTMTLRTHVRNGLVTRTRSDETSPRVEYELSDLGHSLIAPIDGLIGWVLDNKLELEQARERYDLQSTDTANQALDQVNP